MSRYGIQILSYNKPHYLKLTLESLVPKLSSDDKLCIIEQSDKDNFQNECIEICKSFPNVKVIPSFKNLGQRGATNLLYSTKFWDDCQFVMLSDHDNIFHSDLSVYCDFLKMYPNIWVASGYDSPEHDAENKSGDWVIKSSCRAGHMVFRKDDFYKLMPADEKAGSASWYAGLDWWLTHWSPASPGLKRPEIVGCYSGGVEHIGRESTWQGSYDDEYSLEDLLWIRSSNLYQIVKKFPPRHTYIKEPYWYEKMSDEEFKSQFDNIELPESGNKSILAFNYIWPAYGVSFLERSISSIIEHVDKYIIFVNKYSYIGEECADSNVDEAIDIAKKFEKVQVIYNDNKDFPDSAKKDNIGHYYKLASEYADNYDYSYLWLVQSDEIYEDFVIEDIKKSINQDVFKHNAIIFQPICYIDNPHWAVDPPEQFERPSLIPNTVLKKYNYKYKEIPRVLVNSITFHHLSYVLRSDEFHNKFLNWGHRNDIPNLEQVINNFNQNKTNKRIRNLHPIVPELYKSVKFVNSNINKSLFLVWIRDIILKNNKYDIYSEIFKDTICDFPDMPDNMYNLTISERKLISGIVSELIPSNATVVEYGAWNGFNMLMMKLTNPDIKLYSIDNYGKADILHAQYEDQLKRIYQMACRKLFQYDLQKTQIFDGNTKLLCLLKNDSTDFAFLAPGINPETTRNAIIEIWPKLKDGAWICGRYSLNDKIKNVLETTVNYKSEVECPWGKQIFDYYEVYHDLLKDIEKSCSVNLSPQYGIWLARVKKY